MGSDGAPRPGQQGERNSQAVLTWEKVRGIRQERTTSNTPYRVLADKYGVSLSAIRHVVHNTQWIDPSYTPPPRRPYTRKEN